jgi:hypothetical protein
MGISNSNSYSVHFLRYTHTLNNNTQYNRGGQMVAFVNLTRAHVPEAKKGIGGLGPRGALACDKKEHPPFRGRNASAARALRRRNRPTVIAVHRRCATKTIEGPVSTDKRRKPARAFHIYKYTVKSVITPFTTNSEGANSFSLQNFFQSQSVYTRMWIIKREFVYLKYENNNRHSRRSRRGNSNGESTTRYTRR